jgi:hypothetical protein
MSFKRGFLADPPRRRLRAHFSQKGSFLRGVCDRPFFGQESLTYSDGFRYMTINTASRMRALLFVTTTTGLLLADWTTSNASDLLSLKVNNATVGIDARSLRLNLDIGLSENGAHLFGFWTSRHVGERMNVLIDGNVIMTALILGPISGGSLQVTNLTSDQIRDIIPKLLDGSSNFAVEIKG